MEGCVTDTALNDSKKKEHRFLAFFLSLRVFEAEAASGGGNILPAEARAGTLLVFGNTKGSRGDGGAPCTGGGPALFTAATFAAASATRAGAALPLEGEPLLKAKGRDGALQGALAAQGHT